MRKEKASRKNEVREAAARSAASGKVLGWTVFWSLPEQETDQATLETVLDATLGPEYMPTQPSRKRALRQALEAVEAAGLIVRIRDDDQVAAYGLGSEKSDKRKLDFSLEKHNVVVLDKATGAVTFSKNYKNAEIEQLFLQYQSVYNAADLREAALRFLWTNGGFAMRETGGVYFVPRAAEKDALRAYFGNFKGDFCALPVLDTSESKKEVRQLSARSLAEELAREAEEIEAFLSKDNTRDSTLGARLNKFKALRQRAEAFTDLLQLDAGALVDQIDEMQKRVSEALRGDVASALAPEWPLDARVTSVVNPGDDGETHHGGKVVGYGTVRGKPAVKVLFDDADLGLQPVFPKFLAREGA